MDAATDHANSVAAMSTDGPAEGVLRELGTGTPLYAVLDGARDRRIRNWVIDTHAPAWCLFRGHLPVALENAAPWLLRVLPDKPYTAQLFARGWQQSWGIFLASAAPSRELRRHLRRFFLARTEDGQRLLFRYYDPRVLRIYLPTCNVEEITKFFGPVSAMVAEGEEKDTFHVFRPSPQGLEHRRIGMTRR